MKKILALVSCLSLAACLGDTTGVNGTPSDPTKESFAPGLQVNISEMQKVAVAGEYVYIKDLTVGTGAAVTSGATVIVSYLGFLANGSRFDAGENVAITLSGSIIGFQAGMLGMKVGGERLIVIPSDLGYGPVSQPGIPANSTLVFDVKLTQLP